MSSKKKNIIVGAVLLLFIIIIAATVIKLNKSNNLNKSVKIIDYGYSICTQNIPSSSCGQYEVTVQASNGTKSVYTVPGYSENVDERERYQQISSQITQAKENNSILVLKINEKNEIIDVR